MSTRFQEIASAALSANYAGSDWFDQHTKLRFATAVVNRNEKFSIMLQDHGHSYEFDHASSSTSEDGEEEDNEDEGVEDGEDGEAEDDEDDEGSEEESDEELEEGEIRVRFVKTTSGLEELTPCEDTIRDDRQKNILRWLRSVYKTSRGFELGTFDSSLLAVTMKTQSVNWEPIAMGYIHDIISMAHRFISDLLNLICPDERVRDGLMSVLADKLSDKYQAALNHVRFLLHVERAGTPATLNHYFSDNLEKR
jgi:hypothetical protein